MSTLGKALFIVNPASQNGKAAQGAAMIRYASFQHPHMADTVDIVTTKYPGHAVEIARDAVEFDTVVALGGDGIIHEIVSGLMKIDRDRRPVLGVIPCGNGNDYARTLGMALDLDTSFEQLARAHVERFDVGVCNGEYFIETLSFGLDAAIAIGTHERRERTGLEGTKLFLREGIDQLLHHRDIYDVRLTFDDNDQSFHQIHLMAIQIGVTYGGGFNVCPDADATDGIFNVCMAHAPLGFARAAFIFLMAKDGKHISHSKVLTFNTARHIVLDFDIEPPAQVDGEQIKGSHFDVSILPQELQVLVP